MLSTDVMLSLALKEGSDTTRQNGMVITRETNDECPVICSWRGLRFGRGRETSDSLPDRGYLS